ncbi:MAG: helix-turn-helix transcriptional regulator [Nitrospirae bacterium]|nr:helix-turn-helix transcriptional regulator [Nitrospirota bacterium]
MTPDYGKLIKSDYIASHLKGGELLTLVEIMHQLSLCELNAYTCCKTAMVDCIIYKLRDLIPFDCCCFSIIEYDAITKHPENILMISPGEFRFPKRYIDVFKEQKAYRDDPLIKKLLDKDDCYYFEDIYIEDPPPTGVEELLYRYNLKNGYITGKKDASHNLLYYNMVTGKSLVKDRRSYIILSNILIFTRNIMSRLFNCVKVTVPDFTPRAMEIIIRMSEGETNLDISQALDISVNTVKSHISKILKQLGAKNKTQAVALCYGYGILK